MPLTMVSMAALRSRDAVALEAIETALGSVGFVHLIDHGISDEILSALSAARKFFEMENDAKLKAAHPRKGFIPVNGGVNAVRPPHLHEKFSCGRLADTLVDGDPYYCGPSDEATLYFGDQNHWPDERDAPDFRVAYEAAYRAFEGLCSDLHSAIAAALGLPPDFFSMALRKHVTNLCALHYPRRDEPGTAVTTAARVDQVEDERVHPHTDPTSLTVLYHESGDSSGLQVLNDDDNGGGWMDVGSQPGALIINVGDILHFWTNGRLKSARHRVLGHGWRSRLSLVFFCMPGYDTPIEAPAALCADAPARYPSFLCGQRSHFAQSLRDLQGLPDRQLLVAQAGGLRGSDLAPLPSAASVAKRQRVTASPSPPATALQGISDGVDWEVVQEASLSWREAHAVLTAVEARAGPLRLIKDVAGVSLRWTPLLHDPARRSYAYLLRRGAHLCDAQLAAWFDALHPRACADAGAWTAAHYRGEELLRRTAWAVLDSRCQCEYGYSDTWQPCVTDERMLRVLREISVVVAAACGLPTCLSPATTAAPDASWPAINAVNLNYYPCGGGVGWHADDEFLFDSLRRDTAIISLSLCSAPDKGRRLFQIRLKAAFRQGDGSAGSTVMGGEAAAASRKPIGAVAAALARGENADAAVVLGHGDLITMEGLHQAHYLHSVWPGDSKAHTGHELAHGERINLTWRTIVRHLDGSDACKGMSCPLADAEGGG